MHAPLSIRLQCHSPLWRRLGQLTTFSRVARQNQCVIPCHSLFSPLKFPFRLKLTTPAILLSPLSDSEFTQPVATSFPNARPTPSQSPPSSSPYHPHPGASIPHLFYHEYFATQSRQMVSGRGIHRARHRPADCAQGHGTSESVFTCR
jgi:hypothetical protein